MIAATIGGRRKDIPSLCLKGEQLGADLIEIRLDKIIGDVDRELIKEIKKIVKIPLIITKRLSVKESSIKPIIDLCDYIDLEFGENHSLIDYVKKNKKTLIISYHNYKETPKELMPLSADIEKNGADIVKIATFIKNRDDIIRLLDFTKNYKKPIITIGMGPLGLITRLIAPMFGSLITYGFVNRAYADGQPSVGFLKKELKRYSI